jgi:hypothetical protein
MDTRQIRFEVIARRHGVTLSYCQGAQNVTPSFSDSGPSVNFASREALESRLHELELPTRIAHVNSRPTEIYSVSKEQLDGLGFK